MSVRSKDRRTPGRRAGEGLLSLSVAASAIPFLGASAHAEDLRVPSREHPTLADACAAARPGDRIVVRGPVRERALLTTSDVRIRFRGGRLRAVLTIAADRVVVEDARIDGTYVTVYGDDVRFLRADVRDGELHGEGDRLRVERSRFRGPGPLSARSVTLLGESPVVAGNRARDSVRFASLDGAAARLAENLVRDAQLGEVRGAGTAVVGNRVATTSGGPLLDVTGDGADVSRNRLSGPASTLRVRGVAIRFAENAADVADLRFEGARADVSGFAVAAPVTVVGDGARIADAASDVGFEVTGDDVRVERIAAPLVVVTGDRARVEACRVGTTTRDGSADPGPGALAVVGSGGTIAANTILGGSASPALLVLGNGQRIEGNAIPFVTTSGGGSVASGIVVHGDAHAVVSNTVTGVGTGQGIVLRGDGNEAVANVVGAVGTGTAVVVSGTGNRLDGTHVADVLGEGFVVAGEGNVVRAAVVRNVASCAFLLYGPTSIESADVAACGMGIVNLAPGTTITGSTLLGNADHDVIDLAAPADAIPGASPAVAPDTVAGRVRTDTVSFPLFLDLRAQGFPAPPAPPVPALR